MGGNIANFEQIGNSDKPSPSIWADCPGSQLNDLGNGIFKHHEFLAVPLVNTTITAALLARLNVDGLAIDGDDDTVLSQQATTNTNGRLHLETDGDDNDAAAIFSAPFGKIVRNSGKKFWFEVLAAPGDVDADEGLFLGVAELAGLSRDVLADDVGADGVIGESLIGFLRDNGDDNAFDFVYRKDAGTVVTVKADVTNAAAITAAGGTVASLVDDTYHKYGFKFDGYTKLSVFVDGYLIAVVDVDTTFDQSKFYGAIIGIKTGTTAAENVKIDWLRYAYKEQA